MRRFGAQRTLIDVVLARVHRRRRVLVDARTAMNLAILAPVFERLQRDPRVDVLFSADRPGEIAAAAAASGLQVRIQSRGSLVWRRTSTGFRCVRHRVAIAPASHCLSIWFNQRVSGSVRRSGHFSDPT